MNKLFYKSKIFWTGLSGICLSIGMFLNGEVSINSFIIESIPAVMGMLSIIFRWDTNQKLGFNENDDKSYHD